MCIHCIHGLSTKDVTVHIYLLHPSLVYLPPQRQITLQIVQHVDRMKSLSILQSCGFVALSARRLRSKCVFRGNGHEKSNVAETLYCTWVLFFFVSRSSDYGSTYTKLNDKVGSRTVLSYLYVCPTNKQKVSISGLLSLSDRSVPTSRYWLLKLLWNDRFSVSLPL